MKFGLGIMCSQEGLETRCVWLTPVILATQEAEINQEDHGLGLAWANSSQDPILKKLITKKSWWSGSRCRP
jgi:hypothetical protein